MRPRNTIILTLLAAGLFAFIVLVESKWKPPPPVIYQVLPGLKADEVSSILIQPRDESEIRVERSNGVWRLTKPLPYRLQPGVVEKFLQSLETLTAHSRFTVQELQRRDVGQEFGFGKPQFSIVVQQGTNDPRRLNIGSRTTPGDEVYAQVVTTDAIDVLGADFLKAIPSKADEWRNTTFAPLAGLDFDLVKVTGGSKPIELQRIGTNQWRLGDTAPARAEAFAVEKTLNELQNLQVQQFVPDDGQSNLAQFGLRAPVLELAFFRGGTNPVLSLQFGAGSTNKPGLIYARVDQQNSVVLVSSNALAVWRGGPDVFRELHLVVTNEGAPDTIEISGREGQENFSVQRQTNGVWQVIDGQKQSFPADPKALTVFAAALYGSQIVLQDGELQQRRAESQQSELYGLGPNPLRRYTIKRTLGVPEIITIARVDFGTTNTNGIVYARRPDLSNEVTYVYAIRLQDFQRLPATALDLRDRRVWNFAPSNAASVTFRINGTNMTWDHLDMWKPGAGVNFMISTGEDVSRQAEAGVELLGELEAVRWVARAPRDRTLYISEKPNRISVQVKEGEQVKMRTIDIGNLSPDGRRYGAVTMDDDGKEWIFEFDSAELQHLASWFKLGETPF